MFKRFRRLLDSWRQRADRTMYNWHNPEAACYSCHRAMTRTGVCTDCAVARLMHYQPSKLREREALRAAYGRAAVTKQ